MRSEPSEIKKYKDFLKYSEQKFQCCYCNCDLIVPLVHVDFSEKTPRNTLSFEHFKPICAGGEVGLANIRLACIECNNTKGIILGCPYIYKKIYLTEEYLKIKPHLNSDFFKYLYGYTPKQNFLDLKRGEAKRIKVRNLNIGTLGKEPCHIHLIHLLNECENQELVNSLIKNISKMNMRFAEVKKGTVRYTEYILDLINVDSLRILEQIRDKYPDDIYYKIFGVARSVIKAYHTSKYKTPLTTTI